MSYPVITIILLTSLAILHKFSTRRLQSDKTAALTETHGHCFLINPSVHLLIFPTGPINREMRHLISSLQNHNHQLKGDVQRYKRKLRETQMEINKVGS